MNREMDALEDTRSALILRLRSMRTTIRIRLVLFGLLAVMAGGIGAFLVIVAFDWWLWLPGILRVFVGVLFFAGFAIATWYWIARPLAAPLRIEAIAGRIEQHFGELTDRLTSTVDFLRGTQSPAAPMVRKVIQNTEHLVRDMRLEEALTIRPLLRSGIAFASCVSLLAFVLVAFPSWAQTGWHRYTAPFGDTQWPRRVTILPLVTDEAVPLGESLTVRMKVVRGFHDHLRGVVKMRDAQGHVSAIAMRRGADETFATTIDAITEDLTCWFEAGDDSTIASPFAIRAVARPAVLEATVTIEPPPYAPNRPAHVHDLGADPVRAPIGGRATIEVVASKPVRAVDDQTASALLFDDGTAAALHFADDAHTTLRADLDIERDIRFRIGLVDEEGFENHDDQPRVLLAVADRPPVVTLERPTAMVELTPNGVLDMRVSVEDDYGVTSLTLLAKMPGASEEQAVSLTKKLAEVDGGDRVVSIAEHAWDFAPYALASGDVVTYRLVATDNRATPIQAEQSGESAMMIVKIISEMELEMRLRDEVAVLGRQMRELLLEQTELKEHTQQARQARVDATQTTAEQREVVASLAGRQERLSRHVRELSERFSHVASAMAQAGAGMAEARQRIEDIGSKLRETGDGPIAQAAARLRETREHTEMPAQRKTLADAARHQQDGEDQLRAMTRLIAEWGNFRALVSKTRDLLDRQVELRSRTLTMGKRMLGKPVESLSHDEATSLARLRRRQEQLAEEFKQLLEGMERLAGGSDKQDPSSMEASEAARRTAAANDVTRHLRQAVEAIEQNRSTAAMIEQKNVEKGLEKTLAALQQRAQRELDRLRKESAEAKELVRQLIEDLEALRGATREAGSLHSEPAVFADLARQQRQIRVNALSIADDLAAIERLVEAARAIRGVDEPLHSAERYLNKQDADAAVPPQQRAIDQLKIAHELLTQVEEEAEAESLQMTLDQIREGLLLIVAAQKAVNEQLASLVDAVQQRGRVGRAEAREASKLARREGDVRVAVGDMMPDLEEVVVYKWALDRVTGWMGDIQKRLGDRSIDATTTASGQRIVRELGKLIAAIDTTRNLPQDEEFADADGSGGGEGQQGLTKPIPSVAELLVLKAMQLDINERTLALHTSFDAEDATEGQLQELAELGEDQTEVQRLAELVAQNAKP